MFQQFAGESECETSTEKIGKKRLLELTANPVLPGFTAPKILGVKENEPELYARAAQILLPKDYIRCRLTGEYATEVSDAAGTSLLNVKQRRWSEEILQSLDIPTAGAVGRGIVLPGVVSVTIGTSGVVFAHTDELAVEPEGRLHAFCHVVPGAWHVMGVTLAAGGSLRWFRDALGQSEIGVAHLMKVDPYELLMAEAASTPPGSEGLLFLPYLTGERTPYPDPHAKGVIFGLTVRHTKSHLTRAVVEGVTYSLLDCLELIKAMGLRIEQVRASGGGARSELWRQILAEVFNTEIVTLTSTEGAPYGAALLAGVGTGAYASVVEACERTLHIATRVEPDLARARMYQDYYAIYRQMYSTLKPTFDTMSQVVSRYAA